MVAHAQNEYLGNINNDNIERRRAGRAYMMASSSSSPCAACKFLRRKCTTECVFAPYFPPDQPHKFANVHKIFGASNITKLLNDLPIHQREDAVNSLAYEAEARVKDPVYGCVGAISVLQRQVSQLQAELSLANSDLARYAGVPGGGMMSGPGNVSQVKPSTSSLGIGMNLSGGSLREQQMMRAEHYNVLEIARDSQPHQQQTSSVLNREHLSREHMAREQLRDLARAGGGSPYDAAFGMGGALGPFPSRQGSEGQLSHFPSRQGSDASGSGSGMGGHLSSP